MSSPTGGLDYLSEFIRPVLKKSILYQADVARYVSSQQALNLYVHLTNKQNLHRIVRFNKHFGVYRSLNDQAPWTNNRCSIGTYVFSFKLSRASAVGSPNTS